PTPTGFPDTTLSRSRLPDEPAFKGKAPPHPLLRHRGAPLSPHHPAGRVHSRDLPRRIPGHGEEVNDGATQSISCGRPALRSGTTDRKSTRLNYSHVS